MQKILDMEGVIMKTDKSKPDIPPKLLKLREFKSEIRKIDKFAAYIS